MVTRSRDHFGFPANNGYMRFREHRKTFSLLVSPRTATCLATMLLAVAMAGCGDDDGGPDAGAPGLSDVQALFTESCAGSTCHVSFQGAPGAGMDLRPASVCANVINVDAAEVTTLRRIVPGNPDESYLLCKVTPGCSDLPERAQLMPQGSNGLPADKRDLISQWIQAGAPGCSNANDMTPPRFEGVQEFTPLSQAVRLSWQPATDDVTQADDIEYLVYVADQSGGQDFAAAEVETTAGAVEATVSGLEPGGQYFFVVRARDAAGNIDTNTKEIVGSPLAIIDNIAPTFAGVAMANPLGGTVIELSWTAADDDISDAANIKYNVYVAEASGAQDFNAPLLSTSVGQTQVAVRGLRAGSEYFFVVRAEDEGGNEDTNTNEIRATTDGDIFFPQDIQPILTTKCTNAACHDGADPAEGMNLTEGSAHQNLVGVTANQCELVDNRERVEPTNPDGSYLIDKILGVDLCGDTVQQMPAGGDPLSEAEVDAFRKWIEQGAGDGNPVN
jgi:hypothetical protein